MQKISPSRLLLPAVLALFSALPAVAQRYLTGYDSTLYVLDSLRPVVRRLEHLYFSGYIQPQFQQAQSPGAPSYNGGNFSEFANSRFMLRRARIKLDYLLPHRQQPLPLAIFTFQFDATERGVNVRDMFVRLFEPTRQHFALTAGLFARPFGFEINYSSSYREALERGRMSQILMPTERDLGAMLSYESQKADRAPLQLKLDAGLFNGQGLSGTMEFDSYKDFISRLTLKPYTIAKELQLSAGLSLLRGGWRQASPITYKMGTENGALMFRADSSAEAVGRQVPRHYYGADAQLVLRHGWGRTEWRAEYWRGTQPGTATATVNPGTLPVGPTYVRDFDGAFFYFIQNLGSERWELVTKYDWYDPNRAAAGAEIGKTGSNLTAADVRFDTFVAGLNYYITPEFRLMLFHDWVRNERTALPGYTRDIKDNVLTCRIHFRF